MDQNKHFCSNLPSPRPVQRNLDLHKKFLKLLKCFASKVVKNKQFDVHRILKNCLKVPQYCREHVRVLINDYMNRLPSYAGIEEWTDRVENAERMMVLKLKDGVAEEDLFEAWKQYVTRVH